MALVLVEATQVQSLVSTLTTLKADTSTALADISAKLSSAGSTADPATAALIDSAIADIGTLDSSIKAADPGPVVVQPPTQQP